MSSAESWFEVQTAQAEENAMVDDLVDRHKAFAAAYESYRDSAARVADIRAHAGKRVSRCNRDAADRIGDLLEQLSQTVNAARGESP